MKARLLKKIAGAVIVASLVFASSMSAFAADSPDATVPIGDKAPVGDVTIGGVPVENASIQVAEAKDDTVKPTQEQVQEAMNNAGYVYDASATVVTVDVDIVDSKGNKVAGGLLTSPLTIDIVIEGVSVGDTVIVMNYYDGAWHPVYAQVLENGKVRCTFEHLSPVSFAITKGGAAKLPETPKAQATTTVATKASPKTGE